MSICVLFYVKHGESLSPSRIGHRLLDISTSHRDGVAMLKHADILFFFVSCSVYFSSCSFLYFCLPLIMYADLSIYLFFVDLWHVCVASFSVLHCMCHYLCIVIDSIAIFLSFLV